MSRDKLLDRLKNLLPSQFEEVLHRFGIPHAELPGIQAPQASRAVDAIRYAESTRKRGKLKRLVSRLIDRASPSLRPEVAAALDRYRKSKRSGSDIWELGNAGPASATVYHPAGITLGEMYIPLRFAATPTAARIDRSAEIRPGDLLQPRPRQVIIGAAGSGKTTWMRWTFRKLITKRNVLPFFLELRAIAAAWSKPEDAERSVVHYLIDALSECGVPGADAVVNELIANPADLHIVVLVDGWDELDAHGDALRKQLIEFCKSFPHIVVMVSSRPFSASSSSRLESFEPRYIQPLSDDDIRLLAQRFHHRASGGDRAHTQRATEKFMTALRDAPDARSLAGTALLLTMMLLLSRQATLPDKRHRLYDACLRTMLLHRVTRRTGTIDGEQYCPPDGMMSLRVVAELAYRMQEEDYERSGRTPGTRSWTAAATLLSARWTSDQRNGFLRWLIASAGVLMDRTDNSVHFAHLSFQEHLAAYHMHRIFEDQARVDMMVKLAANRSWWATLRLWAGLIGDDKPEKLAPVFDKLCGQPDGFWLVGQMLADGTAESPDFDTWCEELPLRLCDPSDTSDACAMAWGACKQSERHGVLAGRLDSVRDKLHWLDASRHAHWCRLANLDVDRGTALRAVDPPIDRAHAVAWSRVLFGVGASWPDGDRLAVLRLWPSIRAGVAVRFQSVIGLGAGLTEVMAVLPALATRAERLWTTPSAAVAAQSREPGGAHEAIATNEFGKSAEHALVEDFVQKLIEESGHALIRQYVDDFGRGFVRDFVREIVRYAARHLVRNLDQGVVHYIVREYNRKFVRKVVREFGQQFERDFMNDFVSHFVKRIVRDYRTDFARDVAGHFSTGFARVFGRYFGPIVKRELSPEFERISVAPGVASWLDSFALLEAASMVGRATPRLALAHGTFQPEQQLLWLFHHACRMSFGDADFLRDELDRACEPFVDEPLWPALARHMARISTPEDQILLAELAAHPDRCKAPLSWGLQYYVRGDLVFNDGSELTFDDLCQRCGVAPPQMLEEMPAELSIPLGAAFRRDRTVDDVAEGQSLDPAPDAPPLPPPLAPLPPSAPPSPPPAEDGSRP